MEPDYLNDPEFQELIQQYLDYLRESLPALRENLENKNYAAIQKLGHNIKGSGGGYGFPELTELGKDMELAAKDNDHQKIAALFQKLEDFLANQKT